MTCFPPANGFQDGVECKRGRVDETLGGSRFHNRLRRPRDAEANLARRTYAQSNRMVTFCLCGCGYHIMM